MSKSCSVVDGATHNLMNMINNTLKPFKIAINELSSSSNLVEAEGILQFMFGTLSKLRKPLSEDLLQCLKTV